MRKITPRKYAQGLYESLQDKDKSEVSNTIKSFIQVLVRNKVISKSDKIVKAFHDYIYEQEGIQLVSVYSVEALSNNLKKEIETGLKIALKKEIELEEHIDSSLIGGV
ncbi:MAG: F0F1 ATP synthase subunit delta, partial [Patescibacteria group bacterium]